METIDTSNYMLAGFGIFTAVFFGYVVSLFFRWQNLVKEEKLLEALNNK